MLAVAPGVFTCVRRSPFIEGSFTGTLNVLNHKNYISYLKRYLFEAIQDVSSSAWVAAAVNVLSLAAASEQSITITLPVFPLPFLVDPLRLTCFPTIHLTARLLEHLAWSTQQQQQQQHGEASVSYYARTLMNAFVYAVHGPRRLAPSVAVEVAAGDQRCSWECVLSFFPAAMRALLQAAAAQCQGEADPAWPFYVLAVTGREDLGGKTRAIGITFCIVLKKHALFPVQER